MTRQILAPNTFPYSPRSRKKLATALVGLVVASGALMPSVSYASATTSATALAACASPDSTWVSGRCGID